MFWILTVLFLLFSPQFSLAAHVYKWVDEEGMTHFTDDIIQVPEERRPTTERIDLPTGKVGDKAVGEKKKNVNTDRLGRDEQYWRGRVEEMKKRLIFFQERVETLRVKYNQLTERFNVSKSSVERATLRKERDQIQGEMDQGRTKIEETKEMLEKRIPEEGQLYNARPEWIKP